MMLFINGPWNYIGETERCFQTRKKEHQRNLKNYTKGSNVANHVWQNNHSIDFDNACAVDKGNRTFPSPSLPPVQGEYKCEFFSYENHFSFICKVELITKGGTVG